MGDIDERVHLDAARARVMADIARTTGPWDPEWVEQMVEAEADRPENRAAVASAYRAGQAAMLASYCDSPFCSVSPALHLRGPGCPGQAATPDGPRRWALPDGATVVRVVTTPTEWQQATEAIYGPFPPGNLPFDADPSVDALSRRAVRDGALHVQVMPLSPPPSWLTDATPAADGQDGRDG